MARFSGSQGEWIEFDGTVATIGLTKDAIASLGDVLWVNLPPLNAKMQKGDLSVSIESAKAVTDLSSPLSGTVATVNTHLLGCPHDLNSQEEQQCWLFTLIPSNPDELNN